MKKISKKCKNCWNYCYGCCTRGQDVSKHLYSNCDFFKLPVKKLINKTARQRAKTNKEQTQKLAKGKLRAFIEKGGFYSARTGKFNEYNAK